MTPNRPKDLGTGNSHRRTFKAEPRVSHFSRVPGCRESDSGSCPHNMELHGTHQRNGPFQKNFVLDRFLSHVLMLVDGRLLLFWEQTTGFSSAAGHSPAAGGEFPAEGRGWSGV